MKKILYAVLFLIVCLPAIAEEAEKKKDYSRVLGDLSARITELEEENRDYIAHPRCKTHRLLYAILRESTQVSPGSVAQRLQRVIDQTCSAPERRRGSGELCECIRLLLSRLENLDLIIRLRILEAGLPARSRSRSPPRALGL